MEDVFSTMLKARIYCQREAPQDLFHVGSVDYRYEEISKTFLCYFFPILFCLNIKYNNGRLFFCHKLREKKDFMSVQMFESNTYMWRMYMYEHTYIIIGVVVKSTVFIDAVELTPAGGGRYKERIGWSDYMYAAFSGPQ